MKVEIDKDYLGYTLDVVGDPQDLFHYGVQPNVEFM